MLQANFWQADLSKLPKKNINNQIIDLPQSIEKRRNKKKAMERCRRKKISENLMKVHELTLEIIGVDNQKKAPSVRIEKTEILELCYNVLNRLSGFLEQSPNLQKRLRMFFRGKIANSINSHNTSKLSADSGFHEIRVDFNDGSTSSSSNSFVEPKTKSSTQPNKFPKIWRPYI